MAELLLCCALRCSHSRFFCALRWCLLLLQICLLFNHLRLSVSHLSLLFFVTFVFFTLRCHLLFFITSLVLSYYLSFLLLDEAYGRKVVNSTACCSTVFCSLTYVNTFHLRLIAKLLLCFAILCNHSRLFCALGWCLLLLQISLRFNHLRSSAFSHFSTVFVTFVFFILRCHLLFFITSCAFSY